jgi:cholinesterase
MNEALIFILLSVLLAGCSAAAPASTATLPAPTPTNTLPAGLTQIVALGGGTLDNGACYTFWKESVAQGVTKPEDLKNWAANWENRMSNGPLAAEVLAERLKVGLKDYAVCAALSGQDNYNFDMPVLNNTGLLGQIDKFEAELNGQKADPGALYLIAIGDVDVFPVKNPGLKDKPIETKADEAIANITTAITRLAKLGAKQVMIWNTADLVPKLPLTIAVGLTSQAEDYKKRMDSQVPGKLEDLAKQLGIKIILFDYNALVAQIRSDPAKYGLTNLTDGCIDPSSRKVCLAPDEYFFWDDAELSARANQIIAEAMAGQLSK